MNNWWMVKNWSILARLVIHLGQTFLLDFDQSAHQRGPWAEPRPPGADPQVRSFGLSDLLHFETKLPKDRTIELNMSSSWIRNDRNHENFLNCFVAGRDMLGLIHSVQIITDNNNPVHSTSLISWCFTVEAMTSRSTPLNQSARSAVRSSPLA